MSDTSFAEQIPIPVTPHSGIREHFIRAVTFFNMGARSQDRQLAFRLRVAAIYSCQAMIELMYEEATEKCVSVGRDELKEIFRPLIPRFALIERIRIHDFHRFGLIPLDPKGVHQTFLGPMKLKASKGAAMVQFPIGSSPQITATGNSKVTMQRPITLLNGTILDEDTDAYVSLVEIIRDFLTAIPVAVAEYEKLRVNSSKAPDYENSPIWRDVFNKPEESTGSHLPMLSEVGQQNFFNSIHNLWVEPELVRRRESGSLPDGFQIRICLIKLPKDEPPIVQFNGEVHWEVKVKTADGIALVKDKPVHIHEVESILEVLPPTHKDTPVAFLFLAWTGTHWRIVFDFDPNDDDYISTESGEVWTYSAAITEYINLVLRERVIHAHDALQGDIDRIALWPAPALLLYPLSKICVLCKNGEFAAARSLLTSHCNKEFLTNLVTGWNGITAFVDRADLFKHALEAHVSQQYTLSVSALLPQIEGVITDWIYEQKTSEKVPKEQKAKTRKFRDLISAGAQRTYTDQRVAAAVVDFILDGPVLESFNDWLSPVADTFPNRHMIGHGKFSPALYTEECSIKAFLMLDTLYRIMAAASSQ